jgi:acetolactate synthase-1/2/3 large subunit
MFQEDIMTPVAVTIAQTLKAYDTQYFFQVTGGDQDLWIALEEAGIQMIPCRSEKGATYMADGYARITGKPGFVYGQYGPGVSNVAAGLADPYWSMSPVISLTTSMRTTSKDRFEYQELDQLPLHTSLTRWNKMVARPERAAEMLRGAIRAATGAIPGPAHLEIPSDMLRGQTDDVAIYKEPLFGHIPSLRTAPPPEAVTALLDALLSAQRPVLIAGNGILLAEAWDEVLALAEMLSLPVATSMGGKGSIREDHELALGVIGRYSRKVANDIMCECDLALVVGCRLGGHVSNTWQVPPPSTRILHIDVDTNALGATYREEISVQADAKLALQALLKEAQCRGLAVDRTAWAKQASARVSVWKEEVQRLASRSPEEPIHPAVVMSALRAALAPTDIVVADTGYMGAWTGAVFPVTAPGRHYIRAAGSLGWAFPASLGAALGAPGRHVACVTGDGGFGYHLSELETALRCHIPILVVIMNNRTLAFEYHEQKYNHHNHVIPYVNDFSDVDYSMVARAFGVQSYRISDPRELPERMREALQTDKPTVLDVIVDKEIHAPVTAYERVLARTV